MNRNRKSKSKSTAAATFTTAPADTASIYLRLSRESTEAGTGLASQEQDCRALAAQYGLRVIAVHVDDGESGAKRDREGLAGWCRDARDGRAAVLIAWKLDRVSRGGLAGLADFMDVLGGLDRDGARVSSPVRFLSVADRLDSESASWDLTVAVMGALAKSERDAIRTRILRSKAALKDAGRWNGGTAPYGFAAIDNPDGPGKVLAIAEEEADAIREAARQIRSGASQAKVARWMNANGPAPRRAASWTRTTFRQAVTGPAAEALFSPGEYAAIVACLTPAEATPARPRLPKRLLSGVLRCATCGAVMHLYRRSTTDDRISYRCANALVCAAPVSVTCEHVEATVSALWLDGNGERQEMIVIREADERADRLAVAEATVERLSAEVTSAPRSERRALLAVLEAAEDAADAIRAEPVSILARLDYTGRTLAEAWEAGTLEDRRDLLLRSVPAGLLVGSGVRGRHGFDASRLLEAWRLDPFEVDRRDGLTA